MTIQAIKTTLICLLLLALAACNEKAPSVPEATERSAVQGRGEGKENWWDMLPRSQWSEFRRRDSDIEWFEVYEVRDGVFAIYEPGQFEEVISFLVLGEEKALLFDTGLGIAPIRPVVERLTGLPVTVLNSHSHYDHVGGNHEFDEIASLGLPYTGSRAQGLANADVGEFVQGDWLWKKTPEEFDRDTYEISPWTSTQMVSDGDVIDLGGRQLEIIWTPGHAPDAVCLLDRENRLLFTGDTFYLAPLYLHLEGSDVAAYKTSVDRLALLRPELDFLITAHNVPVADADYLLHLRDAIKTIAAGTGTYAETDGAHEYSFAGFSIIVPVGLE